MNTSKALLECYEDGEKVFDAIEVNIGKNGLGWGLGLVELSQKEYEPLKREGDQKAPAGVFNLTKIFGYENNKIFSMPYIHASETLICVDDVNSTLYNQILPMPSEESKSFEMMRRDDNQYELGVVVEHNKDGVKGGGSCIFMHVAKSKDAPTAGCTSMRLDELQKIVSWLDRSKSPTLIQIPKSSAKEILMLYPELNSSRLLN